MRITAIILASAALLAGCGGGDKSSDAEGGSTSGATNTPAATSSAPAQGDGEAALQRAVRAYSTAYLAGDGPTAWGMFSARCQGRVSQDELSGAAVKAYTQYGPQAIKTLTVDVQGNLARATYTYEDSAINQTGEPWVLQGGAWKMDDC